MAADLDRSALLLTSDQLGSPAVAFKLTGDAATAFQSFTARNIGRPLTIVLDNRVISSPIIRDVLPGRGNHHLWQRPGQRTARRG
ncbi:MAG: hypothetical protein KatS3mg057_2471 [Herpetosiphonaceae bacterium]|nr:MAG: hypothetical protein KatS3mg057_2471 [Herpetosiphonaceae bacterium]